MRRSHSPLILSTFGMAAVLVATMGLAWVVAGQGNNIGEVSRSIVASTYLEDLLPRLAIAVLFFWGGYLLTRSDSRQRLLAIAAACAIVGALACLSLIIRDELAFAQVFPNDGAARGWAPGAARAEFLPVPYLSALAQAAFGLVASTALLAISAFRRSPV